MVTPTLTSTVYRALQTESAPSNDPAAGDAASSGSTNDAAGAAGSSAGSFGTLSQGGLIAIIVVVCVVVVFGIVSSVLFYLAKKRSWEIRASIKKSVKRVTTALTPRRSEFPKGVMEGGKRSSRGRTRLDDVPPTPRLTTFDIEKAGGQKVKTFEMKEPKNKWARRTDR